METAELSKRLENLLRIGTVAEVDHARAFCRVQTGKLLTDWLPWFEQRAGNTRMWNPPTVGEQVMILSPSGEPAGGIVLRGIYQVAFPAPSIEPAEHITDYPDGARIAYNHETGALTATGIQTATVQAAQIVTIDCPQVNITGNLTVDGSVSSNGIVLHTHHHTGPDAGDPV